ncbi:uncharacterized protein LOC133682276 [Populus nigra]|uniref:uncharacterized protein LOC133682276 n=1 Tax=Populus nigra TaxID=3691 RepID=UPI002B26FD68|nr:uncharacterized protein LOC133682276 [Populus nigra]
MIDMGKINSPTMPQEGGGEEGERRRAHPRPNMTAPARPERKKRKGKERPNGLDFVKDLRERKQNISASNKLIFLVLCSRGKQTGLQRRECDKLPANSMEAPSELVGGQTVQPSAAETKKAQRRQKMKDTKKQFKKLKANYAKLVKSESSSSELLDRLKNDLEKAREAKRLQEQTVEQQKLMINTLQQLLQLPFEIND